MSQHLLEKSSTTSTHHAFTAVDDALIALAASKPGRVALPSDDFWNEHRLGWMRSVDQQPIAVVSVADVQDVIDTVRFAAAYGLSVSAQPVGHGATAAIDGTEVCRRSVSTSTPALRGSAPASSGASCSRSPASTASPGWREAARIPPLSDSVSAYG